MTSRKARKLANIFLNNLIESGKAEKIIRRELDLEELPKNKWELRRLVKEAIKRIPDHRLLILFHRHVPDFVDGEHVAGTPQRKALEHLNKNYRHEFAEETILEMHLDRERINTMSRDLRHPVIKILAILGKKPDSLEELEDAIEKGKIKISKYRRESIARFFGLMSNKKQSTSTSEILEIVRAGFENDMIINEAKKRFGVNLEKSESLEKKVKKLEDHQLLELSLLALSNKPFTGRQLSRAMITRTLKTIKQDYDHKTAINIMLERYLGKGAFVYENEKLLLARALAIYGKPIETEEDVSEIKKILDTHVHFSSISENRKDSIHRRIVRIVKNRKV